jgi:Xaa-Pro aminopeptidase
MTMAADVLAAAFAGGADHVYVPGPPFLGAIPPAIAGLLAHPGVSAARGNLREFLDRLRSVKSPAEIDALQRAADITAAAVASAMAAARPGVGEHELDASLEYAVRRQGATRLAYPPVIAGGARALTLHYIRNDQV